MLATLFDAESPFGEVGARGLGRTRARIHVASEKQSSVHRLSVSEHVTIPMTCSECGVKRLDCNAKR
jgi:hypothetical protein